MFQITKRMYLLYASGMLNRTMLKDQLWKVSFICLWNAEQEDIKDQLWHPMKGRENVAVKGVCMSLLKFVRADLIQGPDRQHAIIFWL